MELIIIFIALVAAAAGLFFIARNATTVCVIEIEAGKARIVRGAIAPRVLADIGDVIRRPKVRAANVRITRDRGRAAIAMKGTLTEAQEQQLRNVIGSVPLAKLVNARRKR